MKKIILILSVLTVLFASVYLFIQLSIWTTSLKYLAQSQLTLAISKPVRIEKVVLLPFNRIILKKVQFEGFNCEKTVISVNLTRLMSVCLTAGQVGQEKISNGLDSIESITLINPQIENPPWRVNIPALEYLLEKSDKHPTILLPIKVSVNNGTVIYDSTFTINNINFEAVNKNNNYVVKLKAVVVATGKNNFSSTIKVAGMINKDLSVKLNGNVENASLNNLEKLNGNFNIVGKNGNFNLSGNLKSDELNLKLKSNIILDPALLKEEKKCRVISQVSGDINNLRKFAKHLLPTTTFQYLPESLVSFDGSFELPDKRLTINLRHNNLKIANGMTLENVRTNLIFCNDGWDINSTATVFSGDIILSGKIVFVENKNYPELVSGSIRSSGDKILKRVQNDTNNTFSTGTKIQKSNLDLSFTVRNMGIHSDYVSSDISLDTKITGTFDNPKIVGKITADNLSIRSRSPKNVSGRIIWENGKGWANITGSDFALNIEGDKSKITKGNIKYDTTNISFFGKYNELNFHCNNVDISMFTPLDSPAMRDPVGFDKNVSGFIGDIHGYVKNIYLENPEIAASFSSDLPAEDSAQAGLPDGYPTSARPARRPASRPASRQDVCQTRNITINGSTTSLSGEFLYDKDGICIKNLKMDGLSGALKISLNREKETSGYLNFSRCNSNIILPFIGVEQNIISGNITGKINWDGNLINPKPYGTISITRGELFKNIPYNLIVTSFKTNISKIIITELAVQQKASKTSLRLSGEIDKNRIDINLSLNEFVVSDRICPSVAEKTITSDIQITGEKSPTNNFTQFKIASNNLTIDKITEKLFAYGNYDRKKIDLKKITWGNRIIGTASYAISSKYLSSDIDFSLDTGNFNKNFNGPFIGKITVRGKMDNPQLLANYYFDGTLFEKMAKGHGKILLNHNLLKVEETKLSIDGATAEISGIIDLGKKEFSGLNISLSNLKTGTIFDLVKSTYPLSGTWKNIELNIFGDFNDPQITTDFSGKNITINHRTVDSIDGKFSFKSKKIIFSKGSIKWSDTNIKILPDTYIDFRKEIIFRIIAEIRNLKFPGVTLFGGITADGTMHRNAAHTVKAAVSTVGLWVNQKQLENSKHYIEYKNKVIRFIPDQVSPPLAEVGKFTQITGKVDFSKPPGFTINNFSIFEKGKRLFYMNGTFTNDHLDFIAEGENIPMGDLINLLDIKITAEGNTNFNLKASGKPDEPTVTCLLNSTNGKLKNLDFDIASAFFQLSKNILDLKYLKISRAKLYSFEGNGTAPLPLTDEARKKLVHYPIDISLKINNGNLAILQSLTKSVKKAKGTFSSKINIRGTLNKPEMKGDFTASANEIQLNDIFKKLTDVQCEIDFSGKKIKLKNLHSFVDKEPIALTGEIMLADGFNLDNFNFHLITPRKAIPVTINDLQIKSKTIPIVSDITTLPNPSKAKINSDIKFFGTPDNWNIDGCMKLTHSRFTYPGSDNNDGGVEEGSCEMLANANWNLKIIAGSDCWYEKDFASVEAKGEILLHGKGSSPLVTGRVEALRGELDYLGRNFTIIEAIFEAENSKLFLSGRAEAETEIEKRREDLTTHQMITEYVPDTIILTVDRGPLDDAKPKFSSKTNPQMEEQLSAQAAMGLADTKRKQPFSAEEISKSVATLLTTPFIKFFLKKTGFIDKFSMKRETSATSPSIVAQPSLIDLYRGTKLQFGKSFTRGFSAGYGIKFDEFENRLSLKHEIELSYRMKSGIMFRTTQELEKNESGERPSKFSFEKYWRFGTAPKLDKKK
ncbi:MAG: translocation/assembly module TamB domain-containing protein [Elusimicrobiota bacterium]